MLRVLREVLVYAHDPVAIRNEVVAVGGRLRHVLTPRLLVVALPYGVSVNSLMSASRVEPGRLKGTEGVLAEAWSSRLGVVSSPEERLVKATALPSIAWDTPGYTPPRHLPRSYGSPLWKRSLANLWKRSLANCILPTRRQALRLPVRLL